MEYMTVMLFLYGNLSQDVLVGAAAAEIIARVLSQ